jgi:hypothetical protein
MDITNKTLDKGYQLVGEYVEWATDSHQTLGPFAIQRMTCYGTINVGCILATI